MKTAGLVALLACLTPYLAAAADWTQYGGDSARTFFVGNDPQLDKHTVAKLKLRWKAKIENVSKELNSLTVPVICGKYAVVAGSNDVLYALAASSGAVIWQRHFAAAAGEPPKADWLCPNALTATPVIDAERQVVYALASDGRLYSMKLQSGEDVQAPRKFVPPFAKTWSLNLFKGVIYTPTSQGCSQVRSAIYAMNADGDGNGARQFLAMRTYGAGIWGRAGVAIDGEGTLFAGTGDGIFDPQKDQYPNTILAVNGTTLQLKDYFTPKNYAWIAKKDLDMGNTSPVVFPYGHKELVAASGKLGVIWLLDAKCMGGDDHMKPLYASPVLANEAASYYAKGFWGAFATRLDTRGKRWLYAPAWGPKTDQTRFKHNYGDAPSGSIMAFRVTGPDSKPELTPVWRSLDMSVPAPPVVVKDVLFALSDGDNIDQNDAQGRLLQSAFRASHPQGHSVLYAMDASTGKVLYSSGTTIPGFSHFSGIAVANGTVFVITWDNTVYAFSVN